MLRIKTAFILMLFLLGAGGAFAAEVKNVKASQQGNRVVFNYDLVGGDTAADVTVTFTIERGAKELRKLW